MPTPSWYKRGQVVFLKPGFQDLLRGARTFAQQLSPRYLAMTMRWTSLVPSPISLTLTLRQ
jgi:hypothetical protein